MGSPGVLWVRATSSPWGVGGEPPWWIATHAIFSATSAAPAISAPTAAHRTTSEPRHRSMRRAAGSALRGSRAHMWAPISSSAACHPGNFAEGPRAALSIGRDVARRRSGGRASGAAMRAAHARERGRLSRKRGRVRVRRRVRARAARGGARRRQGLARGLACGMRRSGPNLFDVTRGV